MTETTAQSTSQKANFGTFERTHLFERLSVLYLGPSSLRRFTPAEQPKDEQAAYRMALTANARLAAYNYRLDEQSLLALAKLYASGTFCDPATITAAWLKEPTWKPMYPDFPTQVMSMDEATYRLHQGLHYLSTYGVEQISAALGIPGEVREGWLPKVEETEKTKTGGALLETKVLNLAFTKEEAAAAVWQHLLYRNERMTDADVRLAASLPIPADADGSKIVFHENALMLLEQALRSSKHTPVEAYVQRAQHFAAHPGDVIKFIMHLRACIGPQEHFPTSWRRRLVALLESYPAWSLAENLTLDRERSLRALELLSYNRFSKQAEHRAAVDALRDGTLRSWASKKEAAYASGDVDAIVRVLSERPGIMLREVVRMIRVGVPAEAIEQVLRESKLSLATLLNTIAKLSAPFDQLKRIHSREERLNYLDYLEMSNGLECPEGILDPQEVERENGIRAQAAQIMRSLLRERLRALETPLRGKRVMLDTQGYDLAHSCVLTNMAKGVSSYFAPGMAMRIPEEARCVRFFVFWDDRSKRVDLDLHATTDTGMHVGWNGAYFNSGMIMSGDITHSTDAVEYLDVEPEEAAKAGNKYVTLTLHYFNGGTFNEVATAFTGLLVVDKVDPDYKLYQSENVLMRNDLAELRANRIEICRIDVVNRCVVPLMGGDAPAETTFTAEAFLSDLLAAQDATLVESEEELGEDGVKLTVGKAAEGEVSLIDNGWFVLE